MAIARLLPSDGVDDEDGSELNATLRRALELATNTRTLDDLTDLELFARQTDEAWYIDLCIDQLHRLPSEIDPILGCREYTTLQARAIVQQARTGLMKSFANTTGPRMPDVYE